MRDFCTPHDGGEDPGKKGYKASLNLVRIEAEPAFYTKTKPTSLYFDEFRAKDILPLVRLSGHGRSVMLESNKHLLPRYITDAGHPVGAKTWEEMANHKRGFYEETNIPLPPFFAYRSAAAYQTYLEKNLHEIVGEAGAKKTHFLEGVDASYNCIGYVFADGKGGWMYLDAQHILNDNKFYQINPKEAREEDVVIFRTTYDTTTHHMNFSGTKEVYVTHRAIDEIIHAAVVSQNKAGELYAIHKQAATLPLCEQPVELILSQCIEDAIVDARLKTSMEIWRTDRPGGRLLTPLASNKPYQYLLTVP